MALERIAAPFSALPAGRHSGNGSGRPMVGETLQLALAGTAGDDLLATTPDGEPLRLAGLGRLAGGLAPGDILQVRVLATVPQLRLQLLEPPSRSRPDTAGLAPGEEPAAMRPDQLALRQIARPLPDAAALAMAWRTRLLAGLASLADPRGPRPALGLALALLGADPAVTPGEPPSLSPAAVAERWFYSTYAWAGQPVVLRLLDREDEEPPASRRRPGTAVLRLEFDLPGLGHVAVQVELAAGGVVLALFLENGDAVRQVREALPAIAAALAGGDLPLRRCRLEQGRPGTEPAAAWGGPVQAAPGAALPLPLFRAAAEVMVALAGLSGSGGLSPGSR
ncbi:MAG: hypothetical protein H6R10_2086 [Rhodocyclaceae bacterium]|nr:hypothetical protein [Rhodocyclaceae bacterium]